MAFHSALGHYGKFIKNRVPLHVLVYFGHFCTYLLSGLRPTNVLRTAFYVCISVFRTLLYVSAERAESDKCIKNRVPVHVLVYFGHRCIYLLSGLRPTKKSLPRFPTLRAHSVSTVGEMVSTASSLRNSIGSRGRAGPSTRTCFITCLRLCGATSCHMTQTCPLRLGPCAHGGSSSTS